MRNGDTIKREELERRRLRVATLRRQMVPVEKIAKLVQSSPTRVWEDLKVIRQRVIQQSTAEAAAHIDTMVEYYEEVIRQAWRGWRRSLKNEESIGEKSGDHGYITETSKGQSGNPSFLAEISKALWRICELRGLTGKDRAAREEQNREIRPLIGLIINSREELEMLKHVQSLTIDEARPYIPALARPPASANSPGDDEDVD